VDDEGHVLAVTFAIPVEPAKAKFTYHVHLEEVRAFLEARPSRPSLVVPDPWDAGPGAQYKAYGGDRRIDTLVLGGEEPEMLLFDLSGRTSFAGITNDEEAYSKLVAEKGWRFDVALRLAGGEATAFYDTDRDGLVDLVLIGSDSKKADVRMTRAASGVWTAGAATGPVFSYQYLGDAPRQKRLYAILQAMGNAQKPRE
jgi:hypothetical protein